MKFYIIASKDLGVTQEHQEKLKSFGEVIMINHKGKLADLEQLKSDPGEKIIGVDPDTFEWDLDVDAFDNIPNVKAVSTSSSSFDWLKPKELRAKGIPASNCPHFPADSVAEYIVCMAIEGLRKTALHLKNDWKVNWDAQGTMLRGKTAGIVGLGTIGRKTAENLKALGVNVIYWSQHTRDDRFKYIEVDELFKTADIIIPAMAENEKSKKVITKEHIDSMKKSAIIVGINRIKILFDEEYVLEKVAKNELGGYVFEGDNAKELKSYKGNVLALPPIAWLTNESLENLANIWIENMIAIAQGKPQNVVN